MAFKHLIIFLLFLILFNCKNENDNDSNVCTPGLNYFHETFENYNIGLFPNEEPWQYDSKYGGETVVTAQGCAVGQKCLKIKPTDAPGGSGIKRDFGCYDRSLGLYSQFYVKYSFPQEEDLKTAISISFSGTRHFIHLLNNSYGGFAQKNTWYRFELHFKPEPVTVDEAIYEYDSLEPFLKAENITIESSLAEDSEPKRASLIFTPFIQYRDYYFFLDDLVISNDPNILKVGFSE